MCEANQSGEMPIAYGPDGVTFGSGDAALLGLPSPAPVDIVADRAFERLGELQAQRTHLAVEIAAAHEAADAPDMHLETSERLAELSTELATVDQQIFRVQQFCLSAGTIALSDFLEKQ